MYTGERGVILLSNCIYTRCITDIHLKIDEVRRKFHVLHTKQGLYKEYIKKGCFI